MAARGLSGGLVGGQVRFDSTNELDNAFSFVKIQAINAVLDHSMTDDRSLRLQKKL